MNFLQAPSASHYVLGFDLNFELSPELLGGVGLATRQDVEYDERHLSIADLMATYGLVAANAYQSEGDWWTHEADGGGRQQIDYILTNLIGFDSRMQYSVDDHSDHRLSTV